MQPEFEAEDDLTDAELDRVLSEQWAVISRRAASVTAKKIIVERRIGQANRFLIAAVILMTLQMHWGTLTLLALRPAAQKAVQSSAEMSALTLDSSEATGPYSG